MVSVQPQSCSASKKAEISMVKGNSGLLSLLTESLGKSGSIKKIEQHAYSNLQTSLSGIRLDPEYQNKKKQSQ